MAYQGETAEILSGLCAAPFTKVQCQQVDHTVGSRRHSDSQLLYHLRLLNPDHHS